MGDSKNNREGWLKIFLRKNARKCSHFRHHLRGFNRRGIVVSTIVGLILLLFGGAILLTVLDKSASSLDEKAQVDLCRASNEIKYKTAVGEIEDKTKGFLKVQTLCNTIDKTSGDLLVPTKLYPQTKEGATSEIRDMIKNCWYMWLEGSEPNTFSKTGSGKGCKICYRFKIKDGINDIIVGDVSDSLNDVYFAVPDQTHNCDAINGGEWVPKADLDDNGGECPTASTDTHTHTPTARKIVRIREDGSGCCVIQNVLYECENKGGVCKDTVACDDDEWNAHWELGSTCIISGTIVRTERDRVCCMNVLVGMTEYGDWKCPSSGETCYINEENSFSYYEYITESENTKEGERGGIVFPKGVFEDQDKSTGGTIDVSPGTPEDANQDNIIDENEINNIILNGEIYTISFISLANGKCGGGFSGILCSLKTPLIIAGTVILIAGSGGILLPAFGIAAIGLASYGAVISSSGEPIANHLIFTSFDDALTLGCEMD